jgi:MFS superfamily sulfate permease-like transporter
MRWLPGLLVLRRYDIAWLKHDVLAGLALTAVLIPVGVAYAAASGLPGIAGLYATLFGLLAYALFGPSRVLAVGPDSNNKARSMSSSTSRGVMLGSAVASPWLACCDTA